MKPKSAIKSFELLIPSSALSSDLGRGGNREKWEEKQKSEWESSRGTAKNTPLLKLTFMREECDSDGKEGSKWGIEGMIKL